MQYAQLIEQKLTRKQPPPRTPEELTQHLSDLALLHGYTVLSPSGNEPKTPHWHRFYHAEKAVTFQFMHGLSRPFWFSTRKDDFVKSGKDYDSAVRMMQRLHQVKKKKH